MAVKNTQQPQEAEKARESISVQAEQKTATEAAQEAETLVYVGPTLPNGMLKQNSIFVGTREAVEKELKRVLVRFPQVKNLLIPSERLAEAKTKARTPGNALHKWYADVEAGIYASVSAGKEE